MSCGVHRYQKFNEVLVFCERCGETKVITRPNQWIYPNVWTYTGPSGTWTTYSQNIGVSDEKGREEPDSTAEPEGHKDD